MERHQYRPQDGKSIAFGLAHAPWHSVFVEILGLQNIFNTNETGTFQTGGGHVKITEHIDDGDMGTINFNYSIGPSQKTNLTLATGYMYNLGYLIVWHLGPKDTIISLPTRGSFLSDN